MMDEFTELQNGVNRSDELQILLITLETTYMAKRNGTDSLKNDTDFINYVTNLINKTSRLQDKVFFGGGS
jgi:hypothetical protein